MMMNAGICLSCVPPSWKSMMSVSCLWVHVPLLMIYMYENIDDVL